MSGAADREVSASSRGDGGSASTDAVSDVGYEESSFEPAASCSDGFYLCSIRVALASSRGGDSCFLDSFSASSLSASASVSFAADSCSGSSIGPRRASNSGGYSQRQTVRLASSTREDGVASFSAGLDGVSGSVSSSDLSGSASSGSEFVEVSAADASSLSGDDVRDIVGLAQVGDGDGDDSSSPYSVSADLEVSFAGFSVSFSGVARSVLFDASSVVVSSGAVASIYDLDS